MKDEDEIAFPNEPKVQFSRLDFGCSFFEV